MIVKTGDMFESKCSTLVNAVNCVGVMGKGIALQFKKRYPEMFMDYVLMCDRGTVEPGLPYVYQYDDGLKILNFPTKDHWRTASKLSYVIDGLDWFVENYEKYNIESVAFPPLGCGNGGLSWNEVGPLMYQKLHKLPIQIEIYAPFNASEEETSIEFLSGGMAKDDLVKNSYVNPKWYLILQAVKELNERKYSIKVGRTIYQKICYVLTRNGVDTGFDFQRSSYGPFSSQVKESIAIMVKENILVEKQLGRMMSLSVREGVEMHEDKFTEEERYALEKTVDLFGRVKSTEQAEMIATVLFSYDQLAKEKEIISDKEVYDYVLDWKPHWKEKEFDVCDTIHNMAMFSLMNVSCSHELLDTVV